MIGFDTVCVSSWRELMSALLLKADMCSATRNVRFVRWIERSTQHLLILADGEVLDGVGCTDMVVAEEAS